MRYAKRQREHHTNDAALFVRVNRIVTIGCGTADRGERERQVERNFRERRTDTNVMNKWRPRAPKESQSRHRYVTAKRIRDQIDSMSKIDQGANPMVFAEWSASGLEERLRSNHEDSHGVQ